MTEQKREELLKRAKSITLFGLDDGTRELIQFAIKALERSTGHWDKREQLDEDGINSWWWYECSNCGKQPLKGKYGREVLSPFCPFCGSRMESEAES